MLNLCDWQFSRDLAPCHTLPSIATVTKETFIVRKIFILKNFAFCFLLENDVFKENLAQFENNVETKTLEPVL